MVASQQPKVKPLKSLEIIFLDNRRKHEIQLPAELADIKRVDTWQNKYSWSDSH